MCIYKVSVTTGTKKGSATDAKVNILELSTGIFHLFEAGIFSYKSKKNNNIYLDIVIS